jgi:glycerol-3-phosphate dehydrogenase
VRSRLVVDTTGGCGGRIPLSGIEPSETVSGVWCRAFNLVFDLVPDSDHAFALASTRGRLLFFVPRPEGWTVGTWYLPAGMEEPRPVLEPTELQGTLEELAELGLPLDLRESTLKRVECGILPAFSVTPAGEPVPASSDRVHRTGSFVRVAASKYTTFPSLARRIIESSGLDSSF